MAITWRGSVVTPQIQAMPDTNGNVVVLAIVNTFRSRCNVPILRLTNQYDVNENPTGNTANRVMPIIRTRRCAAADVSGGVLINTRTPWDTTVNSPDPGLEIRYDPGAYGGPDTLITAANRGAPVWQKYTMRQAAQDGQVLGEDSNSVPAFAVTGAGYLAPGEALIIEQVAAIPTGGVIFFNIAWEEDQVDSGYVVGGTVNLSGSPVSGAKVLLVTDSDAAMPSPKIETLTTGAPGTFSKTLASGVKASVFVQHDASGTKYTDEGKPFIEAP
jgi:hypothetical protein